MVVAEGARAEAVMKLVGWAVRSHVTYHVTANDVNCSQPRPAPRFPPRVRVRSAQWSVTSSPPHTRLVPSLV